MDARFEIKFLRNHWKWVHSLHCVSVYYVVNCKH